MIGAGLPWNDPVSVGDSLRAAGAGGFPEGLFSRVGLDRIEVAANRLPAQLTVDVGDEVLPSLGLECFTGEDGDPDLVEPRHLSEASEFVGTDIEGSLVRAINHVKLGLVPGGLRAKGYLRIQHRWRPVRQAATSQGQSA